MQLSRRPFLANLYADVVWAAGIEILSRQRFQAERDRHTGPGISEKRRDTDQPRLAIAVCIGTAHGSLPPDHLQPHRRSGIGGRHGPVKRRHDEDGPIHPGTPVRSNPEREASRLWSQQDQPVEERTAARTGWRVRFVSGGVVIGSDGRGAEERGAREEGYASAQAHAEQGGGIHKDLLRRLC